MKLLKSIGLFFVLASVFISCSDEEPDTVGPEIQITNITDNQEFKFGENLVMQFMFNDQTGITHYRYEIYAQDFTNESFTYDKDIDLNGFFTVLGEARAVLLPEKSATETYQEGAYLIQVNARDVLGNLSTYYKPIRIVYPEVAE